MARASIQDIAELAGVSKMTVSRVLRGEGGSRYQERILEAARQLDYIPVRITIQNRRVRTQVIGVLEEGDFLFESIIGSQTLGGATKVVFANGYDLLMLRPQHEQPLEQRKIHFLDRRCDGFIFVVSGENQQIFELLVENDIPAVTCYTTDVPEGIAWVVPDNEQAVREAVDLLVKQGHRHIAFWSGPQGHSDARQRTEAFSSAMREAGLPLYTHSYLWENDEDRQSMPADLPEVANALTSEQILTDHVTAVICHNDERALRLWEMATELGLRVPDDLSIVGIDDTPEAMEKGLTTLYNPFPEIGRVAAQALHSLINGGTVEENRHRIPMILKERNSTAPPRKTRPEPD